MKAKTLKDGIRIGYFSSIIRKYLEKITAEVTGDVLDVGCGDKPYKSVFINAKSYVGIDWCSDIDAKRSNIVERKKLLDVAGSAEALPFYNGSFDAVVATQLIEHIAHPNLFFAEVSRVLRSGSYLILTFPLINPLHEEPHDYFRFTEHGVRILCKDHGLNVEKIEKMGGGWLTVGYLVRNFLYTSASVSKSWFGIRIFRFMGSVLYEFLSFLDKRNLHPECPLNYLIVARKL